MSVARLLAQINNAVPAATVLASSVRPATRNVVKQAVTQQGNGAVVLSGDYVGAADAIFEIDILPPSLTGAAPRVSLPVFAGAGNGTITQPTATAGTPEQTLAVTLTAVGATTLAAAVALWGDISLRAKPIGAGGNSIRLSIIPQLTLSAAPVGALAFAINKDTDEWTDQRLDFGALPLHADGTIPSAAPRLAFGRNVARVYTHYKRWDGTQWRYGISPKPLAEYAINSPVHQVSGTYTATVTDGVTTETYNNVITLYDLLNALATSSNLVEPVGIVVADRKPGGLAAIDIPLRTAAAVLPVTTNAPERLPALRAVSASPQAVTEVIAVTCIANTPIGGERWSVRGATDALADAVTGAPYSGPVSFTLPIQSRQNSPINGDITITQRNFPRPVGDTSGIPAICLDRPRLGAKASARTLRLVWTARPAADCDCKDASVTGGPNIACLGINTTNDEEVNMAIPAWYSARLKTLYKWQADFIAANTAVTSAGELRAAKSDIELAGLAVQALAGGLAALYDALGDTAPPTAALTAWDAAMTGLDADLTALEALGTETPTLSYPPSITVYSGGAVGITAPIAEGSVFVLPGDDGRAHQYKLLKATVSGTPAAYGYLPLHTDGSIKNSTFTDIGGGAQYAWQDLGVMGTAADANSAVSQEGDAGIVRDPATFAQRYSAKMEDVIAEADLVPKSNASRAGGACWQDANVDAYWEIDGEGYLPVFNGIYYHSAKLDAKGQPVSTFEFAFGLQVACPDRLRLGDSITIRIGVGDVDYPYKVGDRYDIAVVAGSAIALAGGVTGNDTLTFQVMSDTQGALPDYLLTLAEPGYSAAGIQFGIHRGGLAFALGDRFRFKVEAAGEYRWRKDGAAWSANATITPTANLTDGLQLAFAPGVAPSFVAGDRYRFLVRQPYSPDHAQSAHGEHWQWSGSTATLTLTWPTDQTVGMVGLLRHGLTAPATVEMILRDASNATLATLIPVVRSGSLVMPLLSTLTTVRSLTITIANATGMSLGWVYAGVPLSTAHYPSVRLRRSYALERSEGINPRSTYLGAGRGGEIAWDNNLLQPELEDLLALIDHCKADGDAPIVLIPHVLHPDDAALVRIDNDAIQIEDVFNYQPNDAAKRRLSLSLPLAPVLS